MDVIFEPPWLQLFGGLVPGLVSAPYQSEEKMTHLERDRNAHGLSPQKLPQEEGPKVCSWGSAPG